MDKNSYMTEKIKNKNMKATPFYAVGVILILISVLIFADDTLAIPIFIFGVIFLIATILITNRFVFTMIKDSKNKKIANNDSTSVEKKNSEVFTIPVKNIKIEVKKETPMDKALKRKQNILESIDIKRKIRKI